MLDLSTLFQTGIKIIGFVLAVFYALFVIVLGKQVQTMMKVVIINDRGLLLLGIYVQLFLSLVLLIYSLFIL